MKTLFILALVAVGIPLEAWCQTLPNIPVDTFGSDGKFECVIAINPADSLDLIAAHMDSYKPIRLFYSSNGGNSWNFSDFTYNTGADPWLAFSANGNAYFTALGNGGVTLFSSPDGGNNWPDTTTLFNDSTVSTDEPVLAVDNGSESPYRGTAYIAAVDQSGALSASGIVVQSCNAALGNHSAIIHATHQQLVQIPHLTIGQGGKLYLSYIAITDLSTLSGGFYMNTSTDGGMNWSPYQLIRSAHYVDSTNGFPKQGFPTASHIGPTPRIAIDTSNGARRGWLYVCYALPTRNSIPYALNIFIQHSTNDGKTWSDPVQVNNDFSDTLNDHFTPTMVLSPDGVIGVAFYDRRDDPNNLLVNLYVAISTDGGETFTNTRVSTSPTNPLLGYRSSNISIADYIGLTASRSNFFPIWSDGRKNNGVLDIYSSIVPIPPTSIVLSASDAANHVEIYPNPFSQSTQITFTTDAPGYADVSIVNLLGTEVAHLFSGELGAGKHSFAWDAARNMSDHVAAPRGMYECLVRRNGRVDALPILLAR